jgi:hypothetical protein
MAGTIAALKGTLDDTINKFNAGDVAGVNANLTNGVDVTSLRPRQTFIGAAAVASINRQQTLPDRANFTLNGPPTFAPGAGTADHAHISGTATWTDLNGRDTIHFDFDCVFDGNRWLFQKVTGFIIGPA